MNRIGIVAAMALAFSAAGCNGSGMSVPTGSPTTGTSGPIKVCDTGRPAKEIGPGMANKAVRGIVNLVTGVVEWPMQTYKGYKDGVTFIKNPGWSKTVGVLKGLILSGPGHWAGRSTYGGVELLTFWSANRPSNDKVGSPLDDEYAWEKGKPTSIFEPTLADGIQPWGNKLGHGVTDAFLGIVELPGQIVKGSRENKVGTGIAKGFWFWWSRSATGCGDAITFLFPNPKDTCGYAWDGEWPWSGFEAKK